MVLVKIALVGVAVIAMLVVSKHQHWPERVGVTGGCALDAAPIGETGEWLVACRQGVLTGFPNLAERQCTTDGVCRRRPALAVHDSARRALRLLDPRLSAPARRAR